MVPEEMEALHERATQERTNAASIARKAIRLYLTSTPDAGLSVPSVLADGKHNEYQEEAMTA